MPSRSAWVGTAEGTSLEESTWKSILRVLPRHTRGMAAPTLASFTPSQPLDTASQGSTRAGLSVPGVPAPTGTCQRPITGR